MGKRVHAIRRGPDGSAFQKCDRCGVSVAIALLDMHEYECGGKICKRSRTSRSYSKESALHDQPRSPFCFFMEIFMKNYRYTKNYQAKEWIEIGRAAFETWVNMTPKEKRPFVNQAEQVNSAYLKTLFEEIRAISREEDEADSAIVGKFDPDYVEPSYYDEYLRPGHRKSFESLDSFDLMDSWMS